MKEVKKRNTKQKNLILETLMSTKSHPNADWIFQEVRKVIPNISLGTVYRNLNSLKADGQIIEILTEKNVAHYDADLSAHSHFVCSVCENILDIPDTSLDLSYLNKYNFKVNRINIEYYGICPNCINNGG